MVLIAVAIGGYTMFKGNGGTATVSDTLVSASPTSSVSSAPFQGSLNDLVARGGNYQCTFDQDVATAHSKGTVYIAGERMRGDFESSVKQVTATITSHMITKDGYAYVWTDIVPNGFKLKTTAIQKGGSGSAGLNGQIVDVNQKLAYSCTPWTVNEALLTLPTNITFLEQK